MKTRKIRVEKLRHSKSVYYVNFDVCEHRYDNVLIGP